MRHLLLFLLLLFTLSGCQDKEQQQREQAAHDAQIAEQARAELLAELEKEKKAQEEKGNRFSHIGLRMDQGTITIDTNKTKDFLKELGMRMNAQIKQVSEDLQKGMINAQEGGVAINNGKINIDLNKTQTYLDAWREKLEGFAKEFDDIAKEIKDNRTKEIH